MVVAVHREIEEAIEYLESAVMESTAVICQCGRGASRWTIQKHAISARAALMLAQIRLREVVR
jgi:hypothetical protein